MLVSINNLLKNGSPAKLSLVFVGIPWAQKRGQNFQVLGSTRADKERQFNRRATHDDGKTGDERISLLHHMQFQPTCVSKETGSRANKKRKAK